MSPSPSHVRMALVGPCRPLSLFRRCPIRDSARECTGRGRNGSSPSPRVFLLSALFVEAVQSCRRRCAVQRRSNRRIAIRNHASNRRRRRLVQTIERADDVRLVVLSPDQAPNPSMSGRSPYNVNFVLLFTSAMNFCVTGS